MDVKILMIGNGTAAVGRGISLLCLIIVFSIASASPPNDTLIVTPRVELGPIQGTTSHYGYDPVGGLIGDLNGDGVPDIVIGINGLPPVVYLNNGTANPFLNVMGVFVAPPPGPDTASATFGTVVLADVNNDGHPDLATGGFNAPNMIYLNNGTSNPFSGMSAIAIGTNDVGMAPAFGDVNGDGFLDMVIANSNHFPSRLYLTAGAPLTSGGYATIDIGTDLGYGQNAVIADINGDGKPDLILTYIIAESAASDPSGIAIYINNGTNNPFANVTPLRILVGQSVDAVAVADLNGDGYLDLVAAVSDAPLIQNDLYVFLNTGAVGTPFGNSQTLKSDSDLGGGCLGISVGDVNGDGQPDLLFSCSARTSSGTPESAAVGAIYLNNGTANPFANVIPFDIPATPQSGLGRGVDLGALVRNGSPDVLIVDAGTVEGGQPGLAAYVPTQFSSAAADAVATAAQVDYLGGGKADYTVWRPSTGYWYSNDGKGGISSTPWGINSDLPVVGDFDGDGKSDVAVWRPSIGLWYITQSSNGNVVEKQWGVSTDIPVAGDFDGDRKTDVAVWRPSTGTWYIVQSSSGEVLTTQWGEATDVPVSGDFDGDGKTDVAVWRPSTGYWYILQSSNGAVVGTQWGAPSDIPVMGDFDGDGKTDLAVWRPSTGVWYIIQSSNGEIVSKQWGAPEDKPAAKDYDGDGKTDIAVFRPSSGSWYVIQSSDGQVVTQQWGIATDVPVN